MSDDSRSAQGSDGTHERVTETRVSRRELLAASSATGLSGLAGCGGDDGPTATTETTLGTTTGTETGTSTTTETTSMTTDATETTANTASQTLAASDGATVAAPGDVQTALDDAATSGYGQVRLVAGKDYQISKPLEIPKRVTLNCNDALIRPDDDINVFEIHHSAKIVRPHVNTKGVEGYSSTIFHVYPHQFVEQFGSMGPVDLWTVYGGWSSMTHGEGTCIELKGENDVGRSGFQGGPVSSGGSGRNVYFCHIAHNCWGGKRYAYLHRVGGSDRGSFINGNVIKGFVDGAEIIVETRDRVRGQNMINGNKFHLSTQPSPDTEWLWYCQSGAYNEFYEWGHNWDYGNITDSDGDGYQDVWYIGEEAGANYLWRKTGSAGGGLGGVVLDESGGDSGSKMMVNDHMGTPVEDLNTWSDAS